MHVLDWMIFEYSMDAFTVWLNKMNEMHQISGNHPNCTGLNFNWKLKSIENWVLKFVVMMIFISFMNNSNELSRQTAKKTNFMINYGELY